jgi:putative (di)nucleoside polyphosphate hydrolase
VSGPDLSAYRPCAGVVLRDARGRIFLGRRKGLPAEAEHAWQMPQGGIDPGEDARTAAVRELREETGIPARLVEVERVAQAPVTYDLPEGTAPAHWRGRWRGQALTWVHLRFLGTDADVDIATEHPEFEDWRWASPKDAVAGIVPFKAAAYRAALAEDDPCEPPSS